MTMRSFQCSISGPLAWIDLPNCFYVAEDSLPTEKKFKSRIRPGRVGILVEFGLVPEMDSVTLIVTCTGETLGPLLD